MGLIIKDELNSGLSKNVSNAYLNIGKNITLVKSKDSEGNMSIAAAFVIQIFESKESEQPFHKERKVVSGCNLAQLYQQLYGNIKNDFNNTEDDL